MIESIREAQTEEQARYLNRQIDAMLRERGAPIQYACPGCGCWIFPNERLNHGCTNNKRTAKR